MENVFFTSDLHLGHLFASATRGFKSVGEHNSHIVDKINETVPKRGKLFIVGDVAFSQDGLNAARQIKCKNVHVILGNHDMYPLNNYLAMKKEPWKKFRKSYKWLDIKDLAILRPKPLPPIC